MSTSEVKALEARLRKVEDQIAIQHIVCGYGYAVDGLNREAVGQFYAEDAVFAVGDIGTFTGRNQISDITRNTGHLGVVKDGCAHVQTLPYIVIDGDRAVATCHTLLLHNGENGFHILRMSASRLQLSRKSDGGWQIDHRQNYMLQGDPAGPQMLARLNEGPRAA
jgi:ketosteroid isomerase-like protein